MVSSVGGSVVGSGYFFMSWLLLMVEGGAAGF